MAIRVCKGKYNISKDDKIDYTFLEVDDNNKFIIVTVEMDYVMFGRNISLFSFIIASILTMIFALLVNFAMYYKLKNVQMVESLKSVD